MATGPEHYTKAESLLKLIKETRSFDPEKDPDADIIAQAQVHATLALAAAMGTYGIADETRSPDDANAWEYAAGEYTAQKHRAGTGD